MNKFANCKNSKTQGDIGLGAAISYFTCQGNTVSLPLTDSQDYDLIVDDGVKLLKIQIKTTNYKINGVWQVGLSIKGGNQSRNKIKKFDNSLVDYLFIMCSDSTQYLIPSKDIRGKHNITLHRPWNKFLIGGVPISRL